MIILYYILKNYLLKAGFTESRWLYFMSSMGAGLVSAILGTPADVIKTRMMNQPVGPDGKGLYYSSSITCLKQAIVNEGNDEVYSYRVKSFDFRIFFALQGISTLLAPYGSMVNDLLVCL